MNWREYGWREKRTGFLQGYSYALKLTVTAQLWKYQNLLNYIHLTETAINLKILPSSSPVFLGIDHKNILWPTLSMIGLRPPFQKVSLSHIQPSPAERDIKAKKKWRNSFSFSPFLSALDHALLSNQFLQLSGLHQTSTQKQANLPSILGLQSKGSLSCQVK